MSKYYQDNSEPQIDYDSDLSEERIILPKSNKKPRVISQAGDSSDEEYLDKTNYVAAHLGNKSSYPTSFILNKIARDLFLEHEDIESAYKSIKDPLKLDASTLGLQNQRAEYDKLIGPEWATLVKNWDFQQEKLADAAAQDFYKKNENKILTQYEDNILFSTKTDKEDAINTFAKKNVAEKVQWYLNKNNINNAKILEINDLNQKIDEYSKLQRKTLEPSFNHPEVSTAKFFAKRRVVQKYDRDIGKTTLLFNDRYKQNLKQEIGDTTITTQNGESLTITANGAFTHKVLNVGSYRNVADRWAGHINNQLFAQKELKDLLKYTMLGDRANFDQLIKVDEQFTKNTLAKEFLEDAELLFGLEVQRNPGAVLTNAMFFDLVAKGKYDVKDLPNKLPMGPTGSVPSALRIDKDTAQKNQYDYRNKYEGKAEEVATRDANILLDWIMNQEKIQILSQNIGEKTLKTLKESLGNDAQVTGQKEKAQSNSSEEQLMYDTVLIEAAELDQIKNVSNVNIKIEGYNIDIDLKKLRETPLVRNIKHMELTSDFCEKLNNNLDNKIALPNRNQKTTVQDQGIMQKILDLVQNPLNIEIRASFKKCAVEMQDNNILSNEQKIENFLKTSTNNGITIKSFPASILSDLTKDMYGLELNELKSKTLELKAAAEPKDQKPDKDLGNTKVAANDQQERSMQIEHSSKNYQNLNKQQNFITNPLYQDQINQESYKNQKSQTIVDNNKMQIEATSDQSSDRQSQKISKYIYQGDAQYKHIPVQKGKIASKKALNKQQEKFKQIRSMYKISTPEVKNFQPLSKKITVDTGQQQLVTSKQQQAQQKIKIQKNLSSKEQALEMQQLLSKQQQASATIQVQQGSGNKKTIQQKNQQQI